MNEAEAHPDGRRYECDGGDMASEAFTHAADETSGACKYCYRRIPDSHPQSWLKEPCDSHPGLFTCRVCGGPTQCAPDPPARAVCPECCPGHDYKHCPHRRDWFCEHCDGSPPPDHYLYSNVR